MKASHLRSIIISLLCLMLIAAFVYYLSIHADKYLELLRLSPSAVLYLILISSIFPVLNGIINTALFRIVGAQLSYKEGILLAAVSSLANQLPLSGGLIFKGVYLNQKFHLPYTKYAAATLALFISFIAVNGFIGIAVLLYWLIFNNTLTISPVLIIGFCAMSASLLVFWLPVRRIKMPNRVRKLTQDAWQGWTIISKTPLLMLELVGLQTLMTSLLGVQYWIAFHMLSQNVSLSQTFLFSSASVLNLLVSIAPGGLGVTEAIVGGIASILGFNAMVSITAVGLYRIASTFIIFLTGGISLAILGKQVTDALFNRENDLVT